MSLDHTSETGLQLKGAQIVRTPGGPQQMNVILEQAFAAVRP